MSTEYEKLLAIEEGKFALCVEETLLNFSDHVYELMEGVGCSQKELASRVGVTPGRISQILSGESNVTLKTVAKIYASFGRVLSGSSVDITHLLDGSSGDSQTASPKVTVCYDDSGQAPTWQSGDPEAAPASIPFTFLAA